MFCLIEMSVKLIGPLSLKRARSAIAITAYLPLVVNFIINVYYSIYYVNPTVLVWFKKLFAAEKHVINDNFF